jgi:hypothetical protein
MIVVLLSLTWLLFSFLWETRTTSMSERGEQQSCLREENNKRVWERKTTIMSERGEQQSCLRENNNHAWERRTTNIWLLFFSLRHDCCSLLSDMIVVRLSQTWLLFSVSDIIVVLLSQIWLLFSSLRYNCCSPLSDMIVVLSQTWLTIMSERGEQQLCLRQRTTIMSEREQQSCLREENNNYIWAEMIVVLLSDMIVILLSLTWLLFSSLRHDCCSLLSEMIVFLLSQT